MLPKGDRDVSRWPFNTYLFRISIECFLLLSLIGTHKFILLFNPKSFFQITYKIIGGERVEQRRTFNHKFLYLIAETSNF